MPVESRGRRGHPRGKPGERHRQKAQQDVVAIVAIIEKNFGLTEAQAAFEDIDPGLLSEEMYRARDELEDFLAKTKRQKVACLNRAMQDDLEGALPIFLLLALLAATQARDLLELRDEYQHTSVPGRNNTATAAGAYAYAARAAQILESVAWPEDATDAGSAPSTGDSG